MRTSPWCSSETSSTARCTKWSSPADPALISIALNRLIAGGGGDAPEAHNTVFHNSAVPSIGGAIGWRATTQKFVVVLSDASPHGAGTAGFANCTDPSVDPLGFNTRTTINEMVASGRSLFMVLEPGFVSTTLGCYQSLALAVSANSRGLPGGTNLATQLVPLISGTATTVSNLQLAVANSSPIPASNTWVTLAAGASGGTGGRTGLAPRPRGIPQHTAP